MRLSTSPEANRFFNILPKFGVMQTSSGRKTLVLVSVLFLFLASPAAADWDITVLDQPYSFENVSKASDTVQVVNLTTADEDEPINESQLTDTSRVEYKYNGSTRDMEWLNSGYWYADFELDDPAGEVEFEAEGETESSLLSDSSTEVNATRSFSPGNMSVDLMTDFSGQVNPEKQFDIQVNVTDDVNDTFEDEADVDFYFTNGSWTSEVYNINNMGDEDGDGTDDHYKNFGLEFELGYDSTYILHINATNTSDVGYNDSYGAQSIQVETLPEIDGRIEYMNASTGCNNESFFTECERATEIQTGFNITQASADNVNLTLQLENQSSSEWEDESSIELTEEDGLYTGQVTVPDVNTSEYEEKFRLRYNASDSQRSHILDKVITYRDFRIVDKSDSVTGPGNYKVKLEIRKYFTPDLLTRSRIDDSLIEIRNPSDESLTSFDVEDMDRRPDPGYFSNTIEIPTDEEKGIYELEAEVTNIYNATRTETFNFNVTDIEQTFELNDGEDDFEKTVDKTGEHEFNITVENQVDGDIEISTNTTGEISDFTTLNDGDNISLDPEESRNVTVSFDIDSVDEYSGEIKFMDEPANYNSTLDVSLTHPFCGHREDTICLEQEDLNVSTDETDDIVETMTVRNFGEKDQEYTISLELSGNVSDYAELNESSVDLDTENDSKQVDLTYSPTSPGFYSGTLTLSNDEDSLEVPVSLDSDVEASSTGISVTETVELGELSEGSSTSAEVELENTGDLEITDIEFSSTDYTVSSDSVDPISPEQTETVTVEFSEVESESGELTVTGETDSDEVSDTVSVSASVIPNYVERANQLEERIIDLDAQVDSDADAQMELNNVQTKVQDIKSAYRQGDYDRAERLYREASTTLDSIERELGSPGTQQNNDSNNQGGLPILPIGVAVFVLLLVGFVVYTSYIPEKGDPLYSVLGE